MRSTKEDLPRVNGASFKNLPNPFAHGQCTWYAFGRADEIGWRLAFKQQSGRDAKVWWDWVTNAKKSSAPSVNSIMCLPSWNTGTGQYGHVAWVTKVTDNNHWEVAQYNWDANAFSIDNVTRMADGKIRMRSTTEYPLSGFLSKPDDAPPTRQTVEVLDGGAGFSQSGPASYWKTWTGGRNSRMQYTQNSLPSEGISNMGDYRPSLLAGRYEVFVWIPRQHGTTKSARYEMYHADGRTDVTINQLQYSDAWVSLGTYRWNAGADGLLRLIDVTDDGKPRKEIAFDDAKWEPR